MTDGNLTKGVLVEEVADAAGLTKKRAEVIVDTLFGSITEALHQGEKVELRGFGSFRLRRREPRRGRNPRTGERVDVPSRRVAYFHGRQGAEGDDQPRARRRPYRRRRPMQADVERQSRRPGPAVFVGRLRRTRVNSLCERRVTAGYGRPVTRQSSTLAARQAGEGGGRLRDQEPETSHELQVDGPTVLGTPGVGCPLDRDGGGLASTPHTRWWCPPLDAGRGRGRAARRTVPDCGAPRCSEPRSPRRTRFDSR